VTPDTGELLALAQRAADRAVPLLLDGRARALATVRSKSTATDMVSELDHAAEELIRDAVLGERPTDGFLGEETGHQPGTSGLRWVVDPLDGTTDYLYDHPGWNVAIAVEDDDGPLAAVVAIPLLGEVFTATRGGGAARNGEPIRCSTVEGLAGALCATGFAYDPDRRRRQAEVLTAVLPRIRDIRRMGAAAADLCAVACGRVDAYWERGLGPWDLAAGSLIAREAGAEVTGEAGGLVVAAAPGIATALRDLLVDSGADQS
jgi:myo-inositol-1(or 4)-monophosphatase